MVKILEQGPVDLAAVFQITFQRDTLEPFWYYCFLRLYNSKTSAPIDRPDFFHCRNSIERDKIILLSYKLLFLAGPVEQA